MVYRIEFYVDGGCRGNGQEGSIGAAAAVRMRRPGQGHQAWTKRLPHWPRPTNQRAEMVAIILALDLALDRVRSLVHNGPEVQVSIYSDSRYAVNCMTAWVYKWSGNGWTNAAGREVANRDLIKRASDLDDELREVAEVEYEWISRDENQLADSYCNNVLDEME